MLSDCRPGITAACVAILITPAFGQEKHDTAVKIHRVGGPGGEVGVGIQPTADGGYLIAGFSYHSDSDGWADLLMHVDKEGVEEWRRSNDGPDMDFFWSIREMSNGDYVAAGTTSSDSLGGQDIVVERFTDDGTQIWRHRFGGEGDDIAWAVRPTSDGGCIVAGQTNGRGAGEFDANLLRLDGQGAELWSRTYGGSQIDRIFSVEPTEDGGFVAAGMTGTDRAMDMMLLRTDARGDELWTWVFGGEGFDVAHDVKLRPDGDFFVVGYSDSYGEDDHDPCVMRVNDRGRLLWMRTIGGPGDERTLHCTARADGGFVIVGNNVNPVNDSWDMLVIAVDSHGIPLWRRQFGGNHQEQGKDVHQLPDGRLALVGATRSLPNANEDIFIVVLDER